MGKIIAFTIVSVDGYFAGPDGGIDWFKNTRDAEDREFSKAAAGTRGTLVFGRTTYGMMAGYWPGPDAIRNDPAMAERMNTSPKIVFSKTMDPVKDGPVWKNVTVFRDIDPHAIADLKKFGDLAILGSGSIVRQFANLGLIDEYQLIVIPVILGTGKPLFKNVNRMNLELISSKIFGNGKIFLSYRPV